MTSTIEMINIQNNSFTSELTGGKELRVYGTTEEPWFVGKDIAKMLGYKKTPKALSDNVDIEDKMTCFDLKSRVPSQGTLSNINLQGTTILINESGLYSLILRSKLPKAKIFKRWVTSEVLPSIRREGQYVNYELRQRIREQNQQLGEKDCKIDGLSREIKEQSLKMDEQSLKMDEQSLQIKELLSYGKTTTKSLKHIEVQLDDTQDTLEKTHNVLHAVAEEIVPPTKKKSLHETLIVMSLNDDDCEYHYKVCRTQIRSLQTAISRVTRKHPEAETIYTIEPTPNVANIYNRFKETYGKDTGRGKNKVFKKVKCSYNSITLLEDTTQEDLIGYLDIVKNENLDMIEI